MMTKTKLKKPLSTRSLTNLLTVRVSFLISVIVVIYAGFSLYIAYTSQQQNLSAQQQLIAKDAGNGVISFIQGKFGAMETAVGLVDLVDTNRDTQSNLLDSLLGNDPAFASSPCSTVKAGNWSRLPVFRAPGHQGLLPS